MSYVYDTDGSLPDGKVDSYSTADSAERLSAGNWNFVLAAIKDVRAAVLSVSDALGAIKLTAISAALAQALNAPFVSTFSEVGGALLSVRRANFDASANPGNSSPALANFNHPLEIGGTHSGNAGDDSASVYVGSFSTRTGGSVLDVINTYGQGGLEPRVFRAMWNGDGQFGGSVHLNTFQGTDGRIIADYGLLYLTGQGTLIQHNRGSTNVVEWYSGVSGTLVATLKANGDLAPVGKLLATGGLGVGNSANGSALGSVVKKMQVFDASGASLGFVPIYNTIT